MQVVILCGGLGTRLRQETEFKPKPMVSIGGKPLLWHLMKYYCHFGIREFVLTLGYRGDVIRNYFANYEILNNDCTLELGSSSGAQLHSEPSETHWRVTLADMGENTLKGARLKRVEKYITGDTFMVTYGDGLSDVDIASLLSFHQEHGMLGTVTGVNPTARFGELKLVGNQVTEFFEKPTQDEKYINGGFFVFNRGVFDYLTDDGDCDLEAGALETIASEGQLQVFRHHGFWACMDTQRDAEYLNGLWAAGNPGWKRWQ